jgi:hypothetical protein
MSSIDSTNHFPQQTPPYPSKMPNTAEKRSNLSISCPASFMSWLQLGQHWFQVELDELYRLHYLLSQTDPPCPLPLKCQIP